MSTPRLRGSTLPAFGLGRPVTVAMLFVAVLVVGVVAWRQIKLEMLPSGFTPPFLYVEIPTLRASPEDVEARIAIPVEDQFATVRNIDSIETWVRSRSAAFLLEFRQGTDMDVAWNQVQDRVERVLPSLGDDIGQYYIWKYNPADDPVIWMAVAVPDSVDDPGALLDALVVPRIERLPGVSRVEVLGAAEKVISIEADDRLVAAAGTDIYTLVSRLGRDNFTLSAGSIEEGGRDHALRIDARWRSLEDLQELPVGGGRSLEQVANVHVEDRSERAIYRVNKRRSIILGIYQDAASNTVDTARLVRGLVEGPLAADARLEGLEYHSLFDQGATIEESLVNLEVTAMWGGFFAVLVLAFFLRRPRMTLLIALAIPSSLLATLMVMYFAGWTLNLLSLMGLMLAVGMVVDNAIVVVESIQRARADGHEPRRAALIGTADVALAIVVATSTTLVVFLPIILMNGDEMLSFYLAQIGMPVCVALVCSLLVSLLVLPLAASLVLGGETVARAPIVERVEAAYGRLLGLTLRRRADAALLSVLAFASMAFPISEVAQTDQSEPNIGDFRLLIEFPDDSPWEERVDVLLEYEAILYEHRDELGVRALMVRMGGSWGRPQLRCFLVPPDDRPDEREVLVERARALLPARPGVGVFVSWQAMGAARQGISVNLTGPDSRTLADLAEEVARRLRHIEGVTSVTSDAADATEPELHFSVDRERALRVAVSPWVVGATLDFALRGRQLPDLRAELGDVPVMASGDLAQTDEIDEIGRLEIPAALPGVALADVAQWRVRPGFHGIDRVDRRTVVSLDILTSRDDLADLRVEVNSVLSTMAYPRGYGTELAGRFDDLDEGARDRSFALLLAVVFVFLLMGVLFESFSLPFSIVLSIPFAFVGVYWLLWATGTSLDMMAGIGLIILVGIVVNNAIVLVDLVSELRRRGVPRDEAIVTAGAQRLRPILMTALTTIFGLVPMAVGRSTLVGIPYAPLGIAVIGGLVASTALTLVVVPLFYTFIDDLAGTLTGVVARIRTASAGIVSRERDGYMETENDDQGPTR